MGGAFHIGRIAGIDLKIHWTFLLLVGWFGIKPLMAGNDLLAAAVNVLLILAVFACVVAHEYGHALAARAYGIGTLDVTLYPIGGVARLREMPAEPIKELVIAVAGPAVNVVIALLLGAGLLAYGALDASSFSLGQGMSGVQFWQALLNINLFLVLFNAIPAFPMDGGRVLRALLAFRIDRVRATDIAASIGKVIAVCFAVIGLKYNPLLIVIAMFVYIGARGEAAQVRRTSLIGNLNVGAAMISQFATVESHQPIAFIRDRLLAGMQEDFPVVTADGLPVGMLYRSHAMQVIQQRGPDVSIEQVMRPLGEVAVSQSDSLQPALQKMQTLGVSSLPVTERDRIVGVLTQENIAELMMLRQLDPSYHAATSDSPFNATKR
ncbi:MAG: site-2 protease family protein [Rubripirellula sp.]|nr:site-2 protease family protein [Rubripirellula sp.]